MVHRKVSELGKVFAAQHSERQCESDSPTEAPSLSLLHSHLKERDEKRSETRKGNPSPIVRPSAVPDTLGTLLFNLCTAFVPALYGTLSIMWVAGLDNSTLTVAMSYTYAGIIVGCFNEGLPRGVRSTTTNRTTLEPTARLRQVLTLIIVQLALGLIITAVFIGVAREFVGAFVPEGADVGLSVGYVRLSSASLGASMVDTAIGLGTRALDHPDVPLAISLVKTSVQIMLELALISKVRVRVNGFQPTVLTQATIRLVCDILGCITGVVYFLIILHRAQPHLARTAKAWFDWTSFKQLLKPGKWTFLESAIRNAIYLYLVSSVVSMGNTYATAWGLFNTIRWGLIMVPVTALEATSNAHTGHRWHAFLASVEDENAKASRKSPWKDIRWVVTPALTSVGLALAFEVPICIGLTLGGAKNFAWYLGNDSQVAEVTGNMWRTVDWMYICYAVSTCLAPVLLATRAEMYLAQSLVSNLGYCLLWAVVIGTGDIVPEEAWWWHQWVFGGSLVFSLVDIACFVSLWLRLVRSGRMAQWSVFGRRFKARFGK